MSPAQPHIRTEKSEGPESREGYIDALETLRAELVRLRAEVEALRSGKSGAGTDTGPLPVSVVVLATEELSPERGFYPLERTEDGVAFAWTGPERQFSFDVGIDRFAGAQLRLEAINFIDFERQKNIQLAIDGENVPATVVRGGIGVIITAAMPPRVGTESTSFVFTLPNTLAPPNPLDSRKLGLAFFRLTLTANV